MESKIYLPPKKVKEDVNRNYIFLAGSIEMGVAEDWQTQISKELLKIPNVGILNPRRTNWNSSWEQSIKNTHFKNQVLWELRGLTIADLILMYFDPKTKSPISLLELGLYAKSNKLVICCPDGFYRKGNVEVICLAYGIKLVNTLEELVLEAKHRYNTEWQIIREI